MALGSSSPSRQCQTKPQKHPTITNNTHTHRPDRYLRHEHPQRPKTHASRWNRPRAAGHPTAQTETAGKNLPTLHAHQTSQPSTSMEYVSLGTSHPAPIYLAPVEEKDHHRVSQVSLRDDYDALLVHSPNPVSSGGSCGDGGLTGTSYEYEMGLGAGGHYLEDSTYDVLDYTHFNGDLDMEVAPAEDLFSRRLRKEGAIRRRKTRRLAMGYQNESRVDLW